MNLTFLTHPGLALPTPRSETRKMVVDSDRGGQAPTARLLDRGMAVAKGRQHPGVADMDLG